MATSGNGVFHANAARDLKLTLRYIKAQENARKNGGMKSRFRNLDANHPALIAEGRFEILVGNVKAGRKLANAQGKNYSEVKYERALRQFVNRALKENDPQMLYGLSAVLRTAAYHENGVHSEVAADLLKAMDRQVKINRKQAEFDALAGKVGEIIRSMPASASGSETGRAVLEFAKKQPQDIESNHILGIVLEKARKNGGTEAMVAGELEKAVLRLHDMLYFDATGGGIAR